MSEITKDMGGLDVPNLEACNEAIHMKRRVSADIGRPIVMLLYV